MFGRRGWADGGAVFWVWPGAVHVVARSAATKTNSCGAFNRCLQTGRIISSEGAHVLQARTLRTPRFRPYTHARDSTASATGFCRSARPGGIGITRGQGCPEHNDADRTARRIGSACRHPVDIRGQRERSAHARARGRVRDAGPPRAVAAARLPRAGVQLAQGDGAARRSWLPRLRAGRARLRTHDQRSGRLRRTTCGRSERSTRSRTCWRWCRRWATARLPLSSAMTRVRRSRDGARCARPDVFKAVAMMSAPFGGAPALPFNTADGPRPRATRAGHHL